MRLSRSLARSVVLAFMSGFVDTLVFIHMGGLFVAHVTGNFVLLGAALAGGTLPEGHSHAATLQIVTFPVFVLAAMGAALVHDRRPSAEATPLLWSVAGLLAIAAACSAAGSAGDVVASIVLVSAMGILNAAQRLAPTIGPPATVMTGNTTGLAVAAARRIRPTGGDEAKGRGVLTPGAMVASFLVGCVLGALSSTVSGLVAVLAPASALAGVLLWAGAPARA